MHRNARFTEELRFLAEKFPQGGIVMDVGCGTGFEPINYSMWKSKISVGFDLSLNSLRIAKGRGYYNVEWVCGSAESLPFRDNCFDFVSAIGSLHHTPDTQKAIDELRRVCRKEVVVMLYYKYSLKRLLTLMRYQAEKVLGSPINKFYSRREVRKIFDSFSRIDEVRGFTFQMRYADLLKRIPLLEKYLGWGCYVRAFK